jgi:hypothetical protein
MASLLVSILSYRTAGPKVTLLRHSFSLFPHEVLLQIKIANAGKGEVDIDGATCDLLGPTVTVLPHRLKAAASHVIVFRAPLHAGLGLTGSVTVNVGMGNGRNLTRQVRMTEDEQAEMRRLQPGAQLPALGAGPPAASWQPPTQEVL